MKKILGVVISKRKLGNSELLVKEIMSSIPGECSLELIRLTDLSIESCRACYRCLQPDQDCPIQDDFNYVMGKIKAADAVVIGAPVYILGIHGYYKMLTDRLVGAYNHALHTQGKPCAIVIPYGTKGWEGYSKASALPLPRLLKMKLIDCWVVHATMPGESLLNPDNLNYAQALGRELFSGRQYQPGSRECPACGSDVFRLLPDNQVECPLCGAKGVLNSEGLLRFAEEQYCRFADEEMEEHFKVWLAEMKHRFLAEKDRLKEVQKVYSDKEWWIKP